MMRGWVHALVLASVVAPFGGRGYRKTEEGNRNYAEGSYDDALRAYTEAQVDLPQSPELFYDLGNVLYRQGNYEGAADAYTRALLAAPEGLVGPASYNLGNSKFQLEKYDDAVQAYERALLAAPQDADAKRNLELALRALEQKKQQQQQQPKQDQKQQPKQDKDQAGQPGQPKDEDKKKEGPAPAGTGDKPPAKGDAGRRGEKEQAGKMSQDQAERMLQGAEEQELDNLRKQALVQKQRKPRPTGADW